MTEAAEYEIRCRAILFDCDGVLVDSTDSGTRSWGQWAIDAMEIADAPGTLALPGAQHLLASLPANWAIVTSASREVMQARVTAAVVDSPADSVVTDLRACRWTGSGLVIDPASLLRPPA